MSSVAAVPVFRALRVPSNSVSILRDWRLLPMVATDWLRNLRPAEAQFLRCPALQRLSVAMTAALSAALQRLSAALTAALSAAPLGCKREVSHTAGLVPELAP